MNTFSNGRWIGVPQLIISWAVTYREDWFREAGITKFPETWDEYREAGRKMKARGKPFGQAFGHSVNDPRSHSDTASRISATSASRFFPSRMALAVSRSACSRLKETLSVSLTLSGDEGMGRAS